jgi:serine/threonine-protein kinase
VDGTPFGRYRLVELLGRGGMGEVWRAHDTDTDRIVAIKLLPAHFSENEDFRRRFRREAHAAARLNTPHVIPIHHYGEIDGRLYVDMRLIEGRDLQSVLADGPLDPARAVRIIEQVAKALHAAHQAGLLHRDVKPSNILLDNDDFAYLIDFGIARAADETRLTKAGNMIGTFTYIAPERLGTRTEEDARADIYSLACVLYECLTGHPPFDADTMAGLVAAHLNTPPPQPSTTQPKVPKQIDWVIATGMAKDPDNRYATTVELADAARDAVTVPIPRPTPSPAANPPAEQAGPVTVPRVPHDRPPAREPSPPATETPSRTRSESGSAPTHWRPPDIAAPWSQAPEKQGVPTDTRRRNPWILVAIALGVLAFIAAITVLLVQEGGKPAPSNKTTQEAPPSYFPSSNLPSSSPHQTPTHSIETSPNYGTR